MTMRQHAKRKMRDRQRFVFIVHTLLLDIVGTMRERWQDREEVSA